MGHLTSMQQDLGKKGLTIIGLNGSDDRKEILKLLTHNAAAKAGFMIGIGNASAYEVRGLPTVAVIGHDGTLLHLDAGGPPTGLIEEALKKVPKATPEQREARAAKRLAYAESFAAAKLFARAEFELLAASKQFGDTDSGKKAAERAKEMSAGENKAEYDAQKALEKMLGGTEKFAEPDRKKAEKLAKSLPKKAAEWKATAPKAAALAEEWAAICAEGWK